MSPSWWKLQILDLIRCMHKLLRWILHFQPERMQDDLLRSQYGPNEVISEFRRKLSGLGRKRSVHTMHLEIRTEPIKGLHQSEWPLQVMEQDHSLVYWMLWRIFTDKKRIVQSVFLKLHLIINLMIFMLHLQFLLFLWTLINILDKNNTLWLSSFLLSFHVSCICFFLRSAPHPRHMDCSFSTLASWTHCPIF